MSSEGASHKVTPVLCLRPDPSNSDYRAQLSFQQKNLQRLLSEFENAGLEKFPLSEIRGCINEDPDIDSWKRMGQMFIQECQRHHKLWFSDANTLLAEDTNFASAYETDDEPLLPRLLNSWFERLETKSKLEVSGESNVVINCRKLEGDTEHKLVWVA